MATTSPQSPFTPVSNPTGPENVPPAVVNFSDPNLLGTQDFKALYQQVDSTSAVFEDYRVINRYEKDYHTYMLGITSPLGYQGASAAFTRLARPTVLWIADWTASKAGDVPEIPDRDPADPNWILLDEHLEPALITLKPDGITPVYRISGCYVYGCLTVFEELNQNAIIPCPPWLNSEGPTVSRRIENEEFQQNIINLTTSSLTGGGNLPQGNPNGPLTTFGNR